MAAWRTGAWALVLTVACGGGGERAQPDAAAAPSADAGVALAAVIAKADEPPPYPPEITSLRLRRSVTLRFAPDEEAKAVGVVAQDTRVRWTRVAKGPGCGRWVELEPRGWVCDKHLEPSKKKPTGVELPKLKPDEIVPGTYGKIVAKGADAFKSPEDVRKKKPVRVIAEQVKVRKSDEVELDGKRYWRITTGELVEASKISVLEPSTFQGLWLNVEGAPAMPVAWARSRKKPSGKVAVRDAPRGAPVRYLQPRTVVSVLETAPDGRSYRIGEGEWVVAEDLHVARVTEPPPALESGERWLDVDLDEQVVVAYEGRTPVYATLVSTGSKKWPTRTGIYRFWIKFAETDMSGQMGDEAPYSVATVPWTMFFAKGLAFHTAYWHDDFGERKSHGCVNLSPRDARTLYFWAGPDVPLGWSMAHGIVEQPGSLVRIRSAEVPEPEYQGYAKRVFEARIAQ